MTPEEYRPLALRTEHTPQFIATVIFRDPKQPLTDADWEVFRAGAQALSRVIHGALGVCTETGELQDIFKKFLIYGKPIDRTNVLEEIGDVLWYVNLVLDAYGFTWSEAFERNIAKLSARFPQKFSQNAALNRDLDAERAALEGK